MFSFFSFASTRQPFECKDIKIALTEIRELQDEINNLRGEKRQKISQIQDLLEENERLNRTLLRAGLTTPPPTLYPASLQNRYCLSNKCYTPTEFALFGIGILVLGVLVGIVFVAWFRNQCVAEDKFYSYSLDENPGSGGGAAAGAGAAGGAAAGGGVGAALAAGGGGRRGDAQPLNGDVPHSKTGGGDQESSLLSNSDFGGFSSYKYDSVVAVNSPQIRRESMLRSQEDLLGPVVTNIVPSSDDKRNGNVVCNGGSSGAMALGGAPLETMM